MFEFFHDQSIFINEQFDFFHWKLNGKQKNMWKITKYKEEERKIFKLNADL